MKKLMILVLLVTGFALASNAQEEKKKTVIELPQWVKNIKISGYGMLQYQADDKYGSGLDKDGNPVKNHENAFNLRLMRLIMDGKIGDFAWRVQMQGSSNAGPGNPTVMLVDLFAEWQKYEFFRVKAGQFKRAFTFENPTHPITQGWYSYATVINSLSGFGDRSGEKARIRVYASPKRMNEPPTCPPKNTAYMTPPRLLDERRLRPQRAYIPQERSPASRKEAEYFSYAQKPPRIDEVHGFPT
jgi:hypothetical protein